MAEQQSATLGAKLSKAVTGLISLETLKEKPRRYWISAIIVLVISFAFTPYIYEMLQLAPTRASLFQHLLEKDPRPLEPRFVKIVLIEDDEYWTGYPSGRRPLKRDYLAQLVRQIGGGQRSRHSIGF